MYTQLTTYLDSIEPIFLEAGHAHAARSIREEFWSQAFPELLVPEAAPRLHDSLQQRIDEIMLGQAPLDYDRMLMQLDSTTGQYKDRGSQTKGHKGATLNYRKIQDLERDPPSAALAADLAQCDMIVECGSVAQLMPGALDRMLSACGLVKPWVMTSPIRGNERAEVTDVLAAHGLIQDCLPIPPFVHRRFESEDEQARAIANAQAAGHRTDGFESTGAFHAQVLLARPPHERTEPADWQGPISVAEMPDDA